MRTLIKFMMFFVFITQGLAIAQPIDKVVSSAIRPSTEKWSKQPTQERIDFVEQARQQAVDSVQRYRENFRAIMDTQQIIRDHGSTTKCQLSGLGVKLASDDAGENCAKVIALLTADVEKEINDLQDRVKNLAYISQFVIVELDKDFSRAAQKISMSIGLILIILIVIFSLYKAARINDRFADTLLSWENASWLLCVILLIGLIGTLSIAGMIDNSLITQIVLGLLGFVLGRGTVKAHDRTQVDDRGPAE